ncbi:LCSR-like protein, partial [Mya arenaria]
MAEKQDIPIEFQTHIQQSDGLFTTSYSYVCKWNPFTRPNAFKLGKWKLTPTQSKIPWDDPQAIKKVLQVQDFSSLKVKIPPQDKIQITWIGHATVLVQIEGLNILADPVFSEKCGPAGFGVKLGYERFTPPAYKIDDLPPIDVVIISHNHHDHLDSQSVRDIARLHPKAKWLVGLGNKKFCVDKGCADYYLEPPQELEKQMYNRALDPKTFFNLRIGETWAVGEDRDYNPPFMEREKEGTPKLTNGPF